MACKECEQLSRAEIDATRQVAAAESRLQSYSPEPPYGEAAAQRLKGFQQALESSRNTELEMRAKRVAHSQTHMMSLSY